jgi:hypothetical protein
MIRLGGSLAEQPQAFGRGGRLWLGSKRRNQQLARDAESVDWPAVNECPLQKLLCPNILMFMRSGFCGHASSKKNIVFGTNV